MRFKLLLLSVFALAISACQTNPVLTVEGGDIIGLVLEESGTIVYRNVPYAAAPVGDLRWRKPQPVTPWEGVRSATSFGNACCQAKHNPDDGNYGTEFFPEDAPYSEDCLYLNVWTPKQAAGKTDAKLPVALWIHGGAFNAGWSFEMEMDGEEWAKRGVILVTANYRLGVFGFMSHPLLGEESGDGLSGNYGLYDQLAALDWVRNNIEQFGGDPDNITLFGQSAGAASVKCLVSSPLAEGKIAKAIIMSGGGLTPVLAASSTQEDADLLGQQIMELGGYNTLEEMREASFEDLQVALSRYMIAKHSFVMLSPHQDGKLITNDFNTAALDNEIHDIPYMIGSLSNDMGGLGDGIAEFGMHRAGVSEQPVYTYYFDRPLPTDGRPALEGAFHSAELWYVFGTLGRSWRPFTEADYALSSEMIDCWTNFAAYGNPNGADGDSAWLRASESDANTHVFEIKE